MIHAAGLTDEQVLEAFGLQAGDLGAGDAAQAEAAALRELRFTEAGRAALRGALQAALRLPPNSPDSRRSGAPRPEELTSSPLGNRSRRHS